MREDGRFEVTTGHRINYNTPTEDTPPRKQHPVVIVLQVNTNPIRKAILLRSVGGDRAQFTKETHAR